MKRAESDSANPGELPNSKRLRNTPPARILAVDADDVAADDDPIAHALASDLPPPEVVCVQKHYTQEALASSLELRRIVFGTSTFLISLGLACNLTLNSIFMGLHLMHRAFQVLAFENTERRSLCAACLSLAWKHWEDREGPKHGPKIRDLVRSIFLLSQRVGPSVALPSARKSGEVPGMDVDACAHAAGLAAAQWACKDGGAELSRMREHVKLYEVLLLRAFNFRIVNPDQRFLTAAIPFSIYRMFPEIGEGNSETFEALHGAALGILIDFYRWPMALTYTLAEAADASVFKAAMALKFKLLVSDGKGQVEAFANARISNVLADLRSSYEWACEIAYHEQAVSENECMRDPFVENEDNENEGKEVET